MPPYIPPHRRSQAASVRPEALTREVPPPNPPPTYPRHDNRGGRGGPRGATRGGRGGSRRDFEQPTVLVDEADFRRPDDIQRYFWTTKDGSGEENMDSSIGTSTFHGSAAQPDKLSYMLLFAGANPRWVFDGIVFAKSFLSLLPGYEMEKKQRGPWDVPQLRELPKGRGLGGVDHDGKSIDQVEQPLEDIDNGVNADDKESSPLLQDGPQPSTETISSKEQDGTVTQTARTDFTNNEGTVHNTTLTSPSKTSVNNSDVNTVPASTFYPENEVPVFPSIAPIDYVPGPHTPIAVFAQHQHFYRDSFAFVGWYSVARINILAPRSAELVLMQQQKWERRDRFGNVVQGKQRDAAAWKSALDQEWAVVKFDKVTDDVAPPAPVIEKTDFPEKQGRGGEKKSVTEMLGELRLKDTTWRNIKCKKDEDDDGIQDKATVAPTVAAEPNKGGKVENIPPV